METEKFDAWAVVEIMGHAKVAGKATTLPFGSTVLLRIDIPETPYQPAFTKMYGMQSVFSITPVTEELAQLHANTYNVQPIQEYQVNEAIRKRVEMQLEIQVETRLRQLKRAEESTEANDSSTAKEGTGSNHSENEQWSHWDSDDDED